jgi:hypothetical protein
VGGLFSRLAMKRGQKHPMNDDSLAQYKTKLIDELEFLLIMAQRNDTSLAPGLEVAITTIERVDL